MTPSNPRRRSFVRGILLAGISVPALCQSAAAQSAIELDPVVVTTTRRDIHLREAAASVSVVTRQEIERRGGSSVADLLRDVPGVTIDESSIPGMKRLRIRGEDARRGMVLIDGQEISDHTTYGPPILIDPALIERIEVVRGPLSVMYGSKAIGGVINIITRQPSHRPLEVSTGAGYDSATSGYQANALASGTVGNFNYRAFFGRTEDGDRRTPAGTLPNSSFNSRSLDLRLGYNDGKHNAWIGYDVYDLSSQSSTPPGTISTGGAMTSPFTKFQLDMPQRDREKVSLFYEGKDLLPGLARVHLDAYQQTIDRRFTQQVAGVIPPPPPGMTPARFDFNNNDTDTLRTRGGSFLLDWNAIPTHLITTGVQVIEDNLDKTMIQTGTRWASASPPPPPPPIPVNIRYEQEATLRTTSIFAQDTWSFAPNWQAVFGGRYYWVDSDLSRSTDPAAPPRSSSGEAGIASAALVWTPTAELTLRAGWGQAYVYPTLLQLHTGSIFGSGFKLHPNPNLQPETSDTFEAGMRWFGNGVRFDGSIYYTKADNYITNMACSVAPQVGCPATQLDQTYINVNSATTYGFEMTAGYRLPDPNYELYGNATLIRRKLVFENPHFETYNSGVPFATTRVGLRYDRDFDTHWSGYWDFYVRAASGTTTQTTRSTATTAGWATINFGFGGAYKTPEGQEHKLSVELLNLADKLYQPTPEELYQPGRSIRLVWRSTF